MALKLAELDQDLEDEEFIKTYGKDQEDSASQPTGWKVIALRVTTSNPAEAFMMALTFFALYGSDANQLHSGPNGDIIFGWISLAAMIVFLAECQIFSLVKPKYAWGAYFWLDLVAALSLLGDIPFVVEGLLGNSFAAARAGRASRAGTRASRIVRVIRLLRLTRMIRLIRIAKGKKKDTEEEDELDADEIGASDVTERLSEYTTAKVIIGLLLMLLGQSFMDATPFDETYDQGLAVLKTNLEEVFDRGVALNHATCDARFGVNSATSGSMGEYAAFAAAHPDLGCQKLIGSCETSHLSGETGCSRSIAECYALSDSAGSTDMSEAQRAERQCATYNIVLSLLRGFCAEYPRVLFLRVHGFTHVDLEQPGTAEFPPGSGLREPLGSVPDWGRIRSLRFAETSKHTLGEAVEGTECEEMDFCLYIDVKWLRDAEAYQSMYTTTLIVVLLVLGMISFNSDTSKLANNITKPMKELCVEMAAISHLDFTKRKMIPSTVFEIKQCQRAYLQMKVGLCSFVKYAPRDIVVDMLDSGEVATLYVKMREITVMFSHITNFDHLCEKISPLKLLDILALYFDAVTESIYVCRGTLLDFIGDMVLAIWNAPRDVDDHAKMCIESAIRVHKYINSNACRKISVVELPELPMSVGINTGNVFVGNTGAHARMKYSVLGDGVNLASRVGELNGRYETTIIISEASSNQPKVREKFLVRNVDCVTVKGKSVGVKVYEVVCRRARANKHLVEACEKHEEAMGLYFNRQFQDAVARFDEVLALKEGDKAAKILQQRCRSFVEDPPPEDWDGADVLKAKHF
jgi:class 3 adenylate cyclase